MKEQFIPTYQETELKILGCEENFQDYNGFKGILWQQAFDFLWLKTGKYIIPIKVDNGDWLAYGKIFKTYEEARLACIDKLIEIVKTK